MRQRYAWVNMQALLFTKVRLVFCRHFRNPNEGYSLFSIDEHGRVTSSWFRPYYFPDVSV